MYTLFLVVVLVAAVLMCGIVLIQNSKGGGLAAGFASSNQIMGVRKTTDFLEKATWTLAALIVVISIAAAYSLPREGEVEITNPAAVESTLPEAETPAL